MSTRPPTAEPSGTPIEAGRNVGPTTAPELRAVGITTVEELRALGWEEALVRVVERYPLRANVNMAVALAGVVDDVDWREVSPTTKERARALVRRLREGML